MPVRDSQYTKNYSKFRSLAILYYYTSLQAYPLIVKFRENSLKVFYMQNFCDTPRTNIIYTNINFINFFNVFDFLKMISDGVLRSAKYLLAPNHQNCGIRRKI